jgi:hypothetical protein
MDYCHYMTALVPTAPMRLHWFVRLDAPGRRGTATIPSRGAAQRGMVGKGNFNRRGRGSMREIDV